MTEIKSNPVFGVKKFFRWFSVFFIMMSYPFLSMMWHHQYPLLTAEVLLFFTATILLCLLLAVMTTACRLWLANVIFTISMTLVLVLQFNLLFEGSTVLLAIMVMLALAMGRKFQQLAFAVFIALIIGAIIDSKLDHAKNYPLVVKSDQQTSLTPVVHIILDGFIGPDGLPPQNVPQALRSEILEFFRENDFELYNRAYSHYSATQDSLVHAFNFTNDEETPALKSVIFHSDHSVTKNRYFELLQWRGYTINIYQSELVEFCQAVPDAVGRCMIYNTPNLNTIRENVSSPGLRFRILAVNLFRQSTFISLFLNNRLWLPKWGVTIYQPKVIDEIGDDLERTRSGVYFAHLLLPHAPFVYQDDCQLDYSSEPWERFLTSGLEKNTVDERIVRYVRYLPQAKCALNEIGRLFDRMRELGLYDDAFIVVHSDHGSRISLRSAHKLNRNRLTPEDYQDMFSTLFAIKLPGGKYREHTETVSLNVLMSRAAMEITGQYQSELDFGVIAEEVPFIYLSGQIPALRQDIDIFAVP